MWASLGEWCRAGQTVKEVAVSFDVACWGLQSECLSTKLKIVWLCMGKIELSATAACCPGPPGALGGCSLKEKPSCLREIPFPLSTSNAIFLEEKACCGEPLRLLCVLRPDISH